MIAENSKRPFHGRSEGYLTGPTPRIHPSDRVPFAKSIPVLIQEESASVQKIRGSGIQASRPNVGAPGDVASLGRLGSATLVSVMGSADLRNR